MNKASGGDGIPVELFQILKDDAVKVLHSIYQKIWKTQQWPQWPEATGRKLPDVQFGFRKGRKPSNQIANICWIIKKKQESSRKTSTSALLTTPKPLSVWITTNCGKFKGWEYQTT